MSVRLKDELRHTGVGLLLGLLGLVFGIFWAVYITVNHESIHGWLIQAQSSSIEEKFVLNPGADHAGHGDHAAGQDHLEHMGGEPAAAVAAPEGHHGRPEMAEAHARLARAHAHAMGLGVMSIALSLLLALVPASPRSKTFAAACVGTGSLFYPLSWILMGMRTTALGIAGAEASVAPMVALSLVLIGLGLLLTLVCVLRWLLKV
jgi:hypothetical protein